MLPKSERVPSCISQFRRDSQRISDQVDHKPKCIVGGFHVPKQQKENQERLTGHGIRPLTNILWKPWRDCLKTVQRWDGKQIQDYRADLQLQEQSERHRGKVLWIFWHESQGERKTANNDEGQIHCRTRQRDQSFPCAGFEKTPLNVNRSARQADAAHHHEYNRHQKAIHRVRVMQRIESQVAFVTHSVVTSVIGRQGMSKLVDADREYPQD